MKDIKFVAEFTTNPMGHFKLLLKMVSSAAQAGCSYIKMQKKDVKTFYTSEKLVQPFDSPFGKTYGEYRELFEFDKQEFIQFDKECKKYNIPWFSTIQDIPSLLFLLDFDLPIYKIASTNLRNEEIFREIVKRVPISKKIVISTAGATINEIDNAVELLKSFNKLTILHCVAEYPCTPENCKLGNITELINRYKNLKNIEIGYSGHEEGYLPSLVAVGLGAKMVERHFCISRKSFVHHIECSLEPNEYNELISIINKTTIAEELLAYKDMLPPYALVSKFDMSDKEKDFLIEQKYGTKYLKQGTVTF